MPATGDLATGVMHRLTRAGFRVMASELAQPTALRRTVAFAEAVTQGRISVEGSTACHVSTLDEVMQAFARGDVPVVVDADGAFVKTMRPTVLIEATLSKRNSGITINDAPIVIALGPGYEAGKDVHAVIETNRGHNLGRVYLQGYAEPNTGVPGMIGGYAAASVSVSPSACPAGAGAVGVPGVPSFGKAAAADSRGGENPESATPTAPGAPESCSLKPIQNLPCFLRPSPKPLSRTRLMKSFSRTGYSPLASHDARYAAYSSLKDTLAVLVCTHWSSRKLPTTSSSCR